MRYVRQWWDGLECPLSFEAALASNSVILGIGGNPNATGEACTIFGVGPDEGAATIYEYVTGAEQTPSSIESILAADERSRSFVLTAITRVGEGRYTFVGESIGAVDGRYEQFETVVREAELAALQAEAETIASEGYTLTASSWEGGPLYALVGTRILGMVEPRTVKVRVTDAAQFADVVADLLEEGYAPVSVAMGGEAEGFAIRVIGEK